MRCGWLKPKEIRFQHASELSKADIRMLQFWWQIVPDSRSGNRKVSVAKTVLCPRVGQLVFSLILLYMVYSMMSLCMLFVICHVVKTCIVLFFLSCTLCTALRCYSYLSWCCHSARHTNPIPGEGKTCTVWLWQMLTWWQSSFICQS